MLTTELPSATILATAATSPASVLRLHGGTEDERLIPIPVGKWSIGSGPRCSIRLAYPGVQPLHCLITCDDQGLRVRRWADGILLNGVTFDEASLASGDRLTIGSIELEVVGTGPEDDAAASPDDAPWLATETDAALDAVQDNVSEMIGGSDELSALPPNTPVDSAPTPADASVAPNRLTRTRRRRLLAALRFQHQMGLQLERAVSSIEQQMGEMSAGQADSTAERARLTSTLATLSDQLREYRREQTQLEQQHADWRERSSGWESRLAGISADGDRLRDEMTKVLEQQGAQETQAVAWNAVVEATDRLSNNYRQLVTENSRMAGEIEKFSAARGELAAEKAAASELLAMLREQHKENQQRQAEFDLQRGQWQGELHSWESRVIERDEWADRFERQLKGIRSSFDAPTIPIAEWKSLSEQVASLTSQQSETIRQRATWESRVANCEARLADGGEKIGAVQCEVESLRAESQEQASRTAGWTALADQVASLVSQQAEWESERRAVRGRVDDCESQLGDRLQQFGEFERQFADLRTASHENSTQAAGWTALSKQVASLRDQQSEWEQRRSVWQGRIEQCETRFADFGRQLATVERQTADVQTATSEPPIASAEWTALSEQVVSLRNQQAEWEQRRDAWQSRVETCESQFGDLVSEVEGLRSAHRDQATQVTELSSLFEQLAALQRQQVEFDQLRAEWQDRVSEWESQLQQRLRQFEAFEHGLQQLCTAQQEQATLVAQLASQQRVGRQAEEPVPQAAVECDPSEHGLREPAIADHEWEHNDVAEQLAASSAACAMAPSDEVAVTEPVVETEPVRAAPPAPVSYLEKYAHIFEDDDAAGPVESLQPPAAPESPYANRNETYPPEPAAEEHHADQGDEESVEQYMAKMMTRIRGDSQGFTASAIVETDTSEMPVSRGYAIDAAEPVAASPNDPGSTVAIVDEATSAPLLNDIEEMKPKTPVPVFAADMNALRALANRSARHAIGVHTARRLRRTALRRCVTAVLAVFAGLCLFFFSPGWQSPQFVGACVAMIAALYLTWLSYDSLSKAIRVGAFQQFDDDREDPAHPPLPIDVDRSHVDR
jgi:DNA repair exonuclease SbcCD ATPase subunit